MKIRFAPLRYKIACHHHSERVSGYAVLLPVPFAGLRFCVRRDAPAGASTTTTAATASAGRSWASDATRRALRYMRRWSCPTASRQACGRWLVRYLRYLRKTGKLRTLGDRLWRACLREAGL